MLYRLWEWDSLKIKVCYTSLVKDWKHLFLITGFLIKREMVKFTTSIELLSKRHMIIPLILNTERNMSSKSRRWLVKIWNRWIWRQAISWVWVQIQTYWVITLLTYLDQKWAIQICLVETSYLLLMTPNQALNWIQGSNNNLKNSWRTMKSAWKDNGNNLKFKKGNVQKIRLRSWNKIMRMKLIKFSQENRKKSKFKIN